MTERVREADGAVAEAVRAMYAAYPDSARFDEHLHPDITIWESDQPGAVLGLPELRELRDRRRAGAPPADVTLTVEQLVVDRWGDQAAVSRYVLRAGATESYRVTDVWASDGTRWKIVHHHAERVSAGKD